MHTAQKSSAVCSPHLWQLAKAASKPNLFDVDSRPDCTDGRSKPTRWQIKWSWSVVMAGKRGHGLFMRGITGSQQLIGPLASGGSATVMCLAGQVYDMAFCTLFTFGSCELVDQLRVITRCSLPAQLDSLKKWKSFARLCSVTDTVVGVAVKEKR